MARTRLLDRMCALHPDHTREELLAFVLCGDVNVDGERVRDPGRPVNADAIITLAPQEGSRYVSRAGLKLDHALQLWQLPVKGKVVLDAGSSTGGFTDCLLQHGARAVHAVDVGYNQLDYRLRRDERVLVHERTNSMRVDSLEPPAAAATADLSFRSLRGAAARILRLAGGGWAVLLIKPQFEWSMPPSSFDGTVPDAELPTILRQTLAGLAEEGVGPLALTESPVRGRRGNREFLLLAASEGAPGPDNAERLVEELFGRG